MILQLNPPIRVKTPLGFGWAMLIFDYDININSIWGVRIDGYGFFKHIESNDIQIEGNPMLDMPFLDDSPYKIKKDE